jgi:hypothetical protein
VTALAPSRRALLAEAVRAALALATVIACAALLLTALDALPAWLAGEPRDVRRAGSVAEVEARLQARLVVPAYFPSSLAWPPASLRWVAGPPGAAAFTVNDRAGHARLLVAQTVREGEIPAALVPEAEPLDRAVVAVGPAQGVLSRVVEDGTVLWQLTWSYRGRSLLLRSHGSVDELLRMARSAQEAP